MKFFKNLSNIQQRIIGAGILFVIGAIFFTDLFIPGKNLIVTLILALFSFGVLHELFNLFFKSNTPWNRHKKSVFAISVFVYIFALLALNTLIQIPFHIGSFSILAALIITGLTDTSAYFIGKKFGKKKLAPSISPNKTWAGFWGGLGLSTVIMTLLLSIAPLFSIGVISLKTLFFWLIVFAFCSIIVQLGDLFESYLKRLNNFKDSGNIIPGHGGLLDRFDGFLFLMFWIYVVLLLFQ